MSVFRILLIIFGRTFYSIKNFNRLIFQTNNQLKIRSLSNFTGSLLCVCPPPMFCFFSYAWIKYVCYFHITIV